MGLCKELGSEPWVAGSPEMGSKRAQQSGQEILKTKSLLQAIAQPWLCMHRWTDLVAGYGYVA